MTAAPDLNASDKARSRSFVFGRPVRNHACNLRLLTLHIATVNRALAKYKTSPEVFAKEIRSLTHEKEVYEQAMVRSYARIFEGQK